MLTRLHLHHRFAAALLLACFAVSALFPAGPPLRAATSSRLQLSSRRTPTAWNDDYLWTRWDAEQYVLVQEGDDLWIGTGGGVLRWHIPTQTPTRYTVVDGLPSHRIFAVAIDPAGSRWFGGDGGLSRLDAAGVWTHFTTANSGLHDNSVHGIAVGADGTLWLSHGLPDGSVSRRAPDGSWIWSPSRAAMVASDYAAVVQTQNANPLWVIADGDIWVDFAVYDGSGWSDRTPTIVEGAHPDLMTAWNDEVWALFIEGAIHHWTGTQWELLTPEPVETPNGGFTVSTMTVTETGRLWVAGRARYCIKGCAAAVILFPVDRSVPDQRLNEVTIVSGLAPSGDGVWAMGPAWLYSPTGVLHPVVDAPVGDTFTNVIGSGDGLIWLSSISSRYTDVNAPAALQGLDDAATTVLHDDGWQIGEASFTASVAVRTPNGDIWLRLLRYTVYGYLCPLQKIVRRHQGEWIEYSPPISGPTSTHCPAITDIFAQDDHNIWFAYVGPAQQDGTSESGVLHLNDSGTATTLVDDVWTNYPFPALQMDAQVAVNDTIWLATRDALYRWLAGEWQRTDDSADQFLCDLTVAEGGYLLAQRDDTGQCRQPVMQVSLLYVVDERVERILYNSVEQFLSQRWAIARTVTQRNPLFAVDTDGAIWHFAADSLCRRADEQTAAQCTSLPASFATLSPLELDANGHIWFAADGALWRWSAQPSFALRANPAWLWMKPDSVRHSTLSVQPVEGFEGAVELSVAALPPHVEASVSPVTVDAGASASLTLTATAGVALGEHLLTVQAVGIGAKGTITQTTPITVWVAAEIYEVHLPIVARR